MKRLNLLFILFVIAVSCKEQTPKIATKDLPQVNFVFDYSKIFTQSQRDSLNLKIVQYEHETSNEIAIVTKDSIPGNILEYSVALANEMGIGKDDKDNGLLILLSKMTRQVRITTGYGTEKILTDSICEEILLKQMIPEFKKGSFYKGIDDALNEIILKWKND